jgi:hypothetical protein
MASVEMPRQREEALTLGYRTFRVRLLGQPIEEGEFVCPASAEGRYRKTCEQCRACSGAKAGDRNATPVIVFHDSPVGGHYKLRQFQRTMARLQAEEAGRRVPLAVVS